jgi:hypothetical protein
MMQWADTRHVAEYGIAYTSLAMLQGLMKQLLNEVQVVMTKEAEALAITDDLAKLVPYIEGHIPGHRPCVFCNKDVDAEEPPHADDCVWWRAAQLWQPTEALGWRKTSRA